ncbi:MAG: nucleotide exchange factor GrpE [Clostridiales bacterium]|nr:nucleotide exchange factor GrpE [Clostridiales bacterium]
MKNKKDIDETKEAAWDAGEAPEEAFDPDEETPEVEIPGDEAPEAEDEVPEAEEPAKEPEPEKKEDEPGSEKQDEPGPDKKEPEGKEPEKKDSDGSSAKDQKSGGPWRRKDKKDKRDEQIEELTDRVRRQMAEFDNFRKRTEKEKSQMFETGARSVIEKILPVIDNFERGLATIPEDEKGGAFAEGMEKVYKQMMTVMADMDVKAIEAVGKEFDPSLHNAVMHIDDEELGENIVAEEFQKGYTYRDTVVRHSMVKVAN